MSGPLLDRIDLHVDVPSLEYREIAGTQQGETSAAVRERVVAARERQTQRYAGEPIHTNARMQKRHVRKHCAIDEEGQVLLRQAMDTLGFSARAYDKILKVARTIADLEGEDRILPHHLTESVNYRTLDRRLE